VSQFVDSIVINHNATSSQKKKKDLLRTNGDLVQASVDEMLQNLNQKYNNQRRNIHSSQLFRRNEFSDRSQNRLGQDLQESYDGMGSIGKNPGDQGTNDNDPGI
jgi:hypothetical protein